MARPVRRSLALALLLPLAAAAATEPDADVLATYAGGTVTAAEWESWSLYRHLDPAVGISRPEIETLALRKALAATVPATEHQAPETRFRLSVAEDRVLAAAYRRHVAAGVEVDDATVEAMLATMDEDRYWPRRLQLRNLSKLVPEGAGPAQRAALRAEMVTLRERLLAGADFDAMARAESESETRFRGGRMGVVEPGRLPAPLEEAVFALAAGELTEVLETPRAYVLFWVEKDLPERVLTLEEARARVRDYLLREADREAWDAALAQIRDAIEIRPKAAGAVQAEVEDRILARSPHAQVSVRQARLVLGSLNPPRDLAEAPAALVENALAGHLERAECARRARDLGLADEPTVAATLHWSRLAHLADVEIVRRVREAFEEPIEEDLRAWVRANPERYQRPEAYRLEAIRLPLSQGGAAERYAVAERLRASLERGELSFEEAAREHSDLVYPQDPGDLGWLDKVRIASFGPNVLGSVLEADTGEIAGPISQDEALWILRWSERREARPQTFDEASPAARITLGRRRAKQVQEQVEAEAREELGLRWVGGAEATSG